MSMSAVIDTHRMVKRLVAKGLSEEVAEEFADIQKELVVDTIATKADLAAVRADLVAVENRLTIKVGVMLVGAVGVLAALITILAIFFKN